MSDEETGSTKSDPLSSATRATKRNLLVVSLIAITFKAFNVSVDKLSFVGFTMTFDRGVFEFLMVASLLYLLLTFILYYYIDIRNFPKTLHQQRTDDWQANLLDKYTHRYWEDTSKLAESIAIPSPFTGQITNRYADYLRSLVSKSIWPSNFDLLKKFGVVPPSAIDVPGGEYIQVLKMQGIVHVLSEQEEIDREVIREQLATFADSRARAFPRRYYLYKMLLWPRTVTVKLAYLVRNYGVDGALPIAAGLIAIAALYGFDVSGLSKLVPKH
jgi:hypothetical protein